MDQLSLSSQKIEYHNAGISDAHPGYVLAHQVPPNSWCLSKIMKSSVFHFLLHINDAVMPPKPAPIIPTFEDVCSTGFVVSW